MFDRALVLLMSGSGAVLLTVMFWMLLWHWKLMLRLQIGWARGSWLRAPALLAMIMLRGRKDSPLQERIKLIGFFIISVVLAPCFWVAFVETIAGISPLARGAETMTRVSESRFDFTLAMVMCVVVTAVIWRQFISVIRRRDQLITELAAYIAEGDQVLGTQVAEPSRATLASFVTAILVVLAGVGLVGLSGVCMVLASRF